MQLPQVAKLPALQGHGGPAAWVKQLGRAALVRAGRRRQRLQASVEHRLEGIESRTTGSGGVPRGRDCSQAKRLLWLGVLLADAGQERGRDLVHAHLFAASIAIQGHRVDE